jgi:predicted ATPase with chaperone activity
MRGSSVVASFPDPGAVSLAHNGVLFLDDLPEFPRNVLEVAMNPCPWGFHNDRTRECRCTPPMIQRYISKISGPLMDRIDIHIDVPAVKLQGNAVIHESGGGHSNSGARDSGTPDAIAPLCKTQNKRPTARLR